MSVIIDEKKAKEIASTFLQQHYSVLIPDRALLKDEIWIVTALISSFGEQSRKVRIDAKTGRIIDWKQQNPY
jgi:uncharacterized membrane protein YkoI